MLSRTQSINLRTFLKVEYITSRVKLYQDAGIDPIDVSMKKTIVKIVYKGLNDIGAPVYDSMFNYEVQSRELRSSGKLIAAIYQEWTPNLENIM